MGIGERVYFGADATETSHELAAEIVARGEFGERHLRFEPVADFFGTLERIGHVPLPPYIDRPDTPLDREQYQTVYSKPLGSVAAPTAGLHFTPEILDRIRARGIDTAEVTLHVGLGTFQPIRVEVVEEHKIHREWYSISPESAEKIQGARDARRRIVAVGTTTVRTLEFAARQSPDGRIGAQSGEADIFIYPGFDFRVIGALLTNFHLPKSTLIMLVSAFAGREKTLAGYEHAVREQLPLLLVRGLHVRGVTALLDLCHPCKSVAAFALSHRCLGKICSCPPRRKLRNRPRFPAQPNLQSP